jgi:hypothetical protein
VSAGRPRKSSLQPTDPADLTAPLATTDIEDAAVAGALPSVPELLAAAVAAIGGEERPGQVAMA